MSSAEYSDPGPDIPENTLVALREISDDTHIKAIIKENPFMKGIFAVDACEVPDQKAVPPTATELHALAYHLSKLDMEEFSDPNAANAMIDDTIEMVHAYEEIRTRAVLNELNDHHRIRSMTRENLYLKGIFAVDACDVPNESAEPPTALNLKSLADELLKIDVKSFSNPSEARLVILHKLRLVLMYEKTRRFAERNMKNGESKTDVPEMQRAVA